MRREYRVCWTIAVLMTMMVTTAIGAPPKMKMTTDIPESILTPDRVKTSIGTFL